MKAKTPDASDVIHQFNQAFLQHDGSLLKDLVAEDCVMESVEPAPDGTRYVGRNACLEFWQNLANNRDGAFATEDIVVFADRAIIIALGRGFRSRSGE
jgi:ketosteroid isomerase-like protein